MRLRSVEQRPIVTWDLENRPSAYWQPDRPTAEVTAIGWKWLHEPEPHVLLLNKDGRFVHDGRKRPLSAHHAYGLFRDVLCRAGLVVGHNIRQHDLGLFQAGLWRLQLPLLPRLLTTDTLRDIPRRKDMSASLENLAALYDLDEDGKKHMSVTDWERANRLAPEGIDAARERVVSDVLLQERLRARLLELGLLKAPRVWTP